MKSITLTLSAVAVLASTPARAQSSPPGLQPPPTVQQNVGFPVGEKSRLHANLDLGLAFDSNPDRFPDASRQSGTRAIIRPSVGLEVPGTTYSLGLTAGLTIGQFFATGSRAASTDFGGDVGLNARAGSPDSAVAFRVTDLLARTPTYLSQLGAFPADERRFQAWTNRGEAVVTFRPGGRALDLDLGYTNALYLYDNLPKSQQHGALFEARLRFLPKTSLLFHSDISFFSTNESGTTPAGMPNPTGGTLGPTRKSTPYNLLVGLVGQVTERLSAQLTAGFGDSLTWQDGFFSGGTAADNRRNFIATALFAYAFGDSALFSLGYQRKIVPIIVLDSYLSNALQARLVWGIGRMSLGLFGEYSFISYSRIDANPQLLVGDARADYWFTDYLTAGLNYRVLRQGNVGVAAMAGTPAASSLLEEYTRHLLVASVGVHY